MEDELIGILQEYVATANNPEYNSNWDVINSKFPELAQYDRDLLQEYVATANNPEYNSDWNVINSKFPEFTATTPAVEPKKETAEANLESASPSADLESSSDSTLAGKLPDISTFMSQALADVADTPYGRRKIEQAAASVVDSDPQKKREIQELRETGNQDVAEDVRQRYISEKMQEDSKFSKFDELKKVVSENTESVQLDDKPFIETVYEELSARANNKYENPEADVTELKEIYGDMDKYGLNLNDFEGFIEQGNSNIKNIYRAGYFTTDTTDILLNSDEEKQLRETAKHNTLGIYLNDRLANLNGKYLGLSKRGMMEEANEVRDEIMKTVKGYKDYVQTELPNYYKAQQQKLVDEYHEYTYTKTVGDIKKAKLAALQTTENLFEGFFNASGDATAYILDLIGADDESEYQRMINSYNKEFDSNSLDYGIVEGFKVNHKGTNYRVTEDNRIIDIDLGKDVTAIADIIGLDRDAILGKAKASNNFGTDYSTSGLIKQVGSVLGNLAFQVAATRGVNGTLGLTSKAKTMISTMTVQSGIVSSSTYEETLSALRNANIDDEKAKGEALDLSLKMGAITALTSMISPNSGAIGVTNKQVDKALVKKLATSYATGGKEAFKKTLFQQLKAKGAIMAREGIEESIQEMIELIAQKNFNATVNQNLGDDVLDTNISKAEIIETFVLSAATGSLAASLGKTQTDYNDTLSILNQLSKDVNTSTKYINDLESAGAISKESADKIKKRLMNFTKYSNKIPKDIDVKRVEPLLEKLDERNELEMRKKNEDPAFHERIKAKIASVDKDIDFILNGDNNLVIPSSKDLKQTLKKKSWGIVTASNPNATEASPDENIEYNKIAKQWLIDRGYEVQDVEGSYDGMYETGFFVPDLNIDDAIEFAREFNQESVATSKGLVYQDGSYNPRVKGETVGGEFDGNFSTMKLPEGKVNFQVNYDFDNRIYEQNLLTTVRESMSKIQSDPTGLFKVAWDGAIEATSKTIELTGDVAQAIDNGFKALKASDWYKQLSDNGKKMAERKFRDSLRVDLDTIVSEEKANIIKKDVIKVTEREAQDISSVQSAKQKYLDVFTNINESIKSLKGANTFWKKQGLYETRTADALNELEIEVTRILKVISKSKFKASDVSDYMKYKHAPDRNKYIQENVNEENPFGSGWTQSKIDDFKKKFTKEEFKELEKLSKPLYDIRDNMRKKMVEYGLISAEGMKKLEKLMGDFYVPMTGFADESIEIGNNVVQGKKLTVKKKGYKSALGRTTEAGNIIANLLFQYSDVIITGEKNLLLQSLADVKKTNTKEDVPFSIYTDETLPKRRTRGSDNKLSYVKENPDSMSSNNPYIGYKVNGKHMYIKFDNPVLASNLRKATDSTIDDFTKGFGRVNRALSAMFTQYNPVFMLGNFEADIQTALINLKAQADINPDLKGKDLSYEVAKTVLPSIKAIHRIERGKQAKSDLEKSYLDAKKQGVKTGWTNRMNLKEMSLKISDMEKMMTAGKLSPLQIKKGFNGFLSVIDNANTAVENGVRLATYKAAIDAGLSKLDAASLAKELTINFNRRGETGALFNTLYLFFNAGVQSSAVYARNMFTFKEYTDSKGNKKKTLNRGQKVATGIILASSLLTMYNMAVSGEDDESGLDYYTQEIQDYEKERYMIIVKPDGRSHWKIKMPYGYNLFSNLGTMISEVAFGDRKAKSASSFLMGGMVNSFSPFSSPERDSKLLESGYMAVPTVLKPLGMLLENKDNYGRPIFRENFPFSNMQLSSSYLGSKRTPEEIKRFTILMNSLGGGNAYESSTLDMHPDKINFLVNYFGGGAFKFIKDTYGVIDTGLKVNQGAEIPFDIMSVPFVNKVYGEDTSFPEMKIYYNVKDKYRRRLNFLSSKEGREAHLDEPTEKVNLQILESYYKDSEGQLQELRKQEKKILLIEDGIKRAEELEKLDVKKRKVYATHIRKYLKIKERLTRNYE